jgi:ribonuclease PH
MHTRPIQFIIDAFTPPRITTPIVLQNNSEMQHVRNLQDFIRSGAGSYQKVLACFGQTQVLCSVYIQGGAKYLPEHARQKNQGWLSAEYQMLPHSTHIRQKRESRGQISGRSQEIQRLIGRSLRAALDLIALKDLNITVDCDVLCADGGTRTTAINGSFLALALALKKLSVDYQVPELLNQALKKHIAAVSIGLLDCSDHSVDHHFDQDIKKNAFKYIIDLDYEQDSQALVDANIILASPSPFNHLAIQTNNDIYNYEIVEVQASAEGQTFSFEQLQHMLDLAKIGILQIQQQQNMFLI